MFRYSATHKKPPAKNKVRPIITSIFDMQIFYFRNEFITDLLDH